MRKHVSNIEYYPCRYKEALTSLLTSIVQKFQFRYNQSQLEELDDDTLDDDVCSLSVVMLT